MILKYYLKPKGNKSYLVYLALYANGGREIISTGQRCQITEWNKKDNIPRKADSKLSLEIKQIRDAVENIMFERKARQEAITPVILKNAYTKSTKAKVVKEVIQDKKIKSDGSQVSDLIDKYLNKDIKHYAQRTQDNIWVSLDTIFKGYLTDNAPDLERKDLTLDFITSYTNWLTEEGYADSTHGKTVMHLKWFLKSIKWNADDRDDIKVKIIKSGQNNIITLTKPELALLEAYDVSKSGNRIKEKQKAKDLFLLGCYLGFRVSDLKRIKPEHIINGRVCMTSKKTGQLMVVPMLPEAEAILKRYDYHAPRLSEQGVNDWIKPICKDAGITKPTIFKTVYGGVLKEPVYPKHELITTHVAGKTFITLAQYWDLTPSEIAAIVAKSVKTVLRYYFKPDVERAAEKMLAGVNRDKMRVLESQNQQKSA